MNKEIKLVINELVESLIPTNENLETVYKKLSEIDMNIANYFKGAFEKKILGVKRLRKAKKIIEKEIERIDDHFAKRAIERLKDI